MSSGCCIPPIRVRLRVLYSNNSVRLNMKNPDAGNVCQKDYNGLIPLDYDMDGDWYINSNTIIDPKKSRYYVERLVVPVKNDPNLVKKEEGGFVGDPDIDNDDVLNAGDYDKDNDGMEDGYEWDYGLGADGWQNPFVFNARYALLIGGGGIGKDEDKKDRNYPAFGNDLKEMYDKLKGYGYTDENIYSFLWNKTGSYSYWVDGPAIWEKDDIVTGSGYEDEFIISDAFKAIGEKITKNDFFYFVEICHGGGDPTAKDSFFSTFRIYKQNGQIHYNSRGIWFATHLLPSLNFSVKTYARSLFVFQSCRASCGISRIASDNRIIITPENYEVDEWTDLGNTYTKIEKEEEEANRHWAFIYESYYRWWDWGWHEKTPDGFILSLGSSSDAKSVLHAFNKGYYAATHNYMGRWPQEDIDGRSHPMLEDTGDEATQGKLDPSSSTDEGWLAEYTYL